MGLRSPLDLEAAVVLHSVGDVLMIELYILKLSKFVSPGAIVIILKDEG